MKSAEAMAGRRRGPPASRVRGAALLFVVWATAMLALIIGGYALVTHVEHLQARNLFDTTKARYFAEAGLHRVVLEMRLPDPTTRWIADGRTYAFEMDGALIEIEIVDESGKLDLNIADELTLVNFMRGKGVEEEQAVALAQAIIDWRDPDDLALPFGAEDDGYRSGGYPYGAKDAYFDTVAELQQVMGMTYPLFRELEPAVTVYAGRTQPNAAYASADALLALPGMTPELAAEFVAQRRSMPLGDPAMSGLLTLPDGTPVMAGGGGFTYSVRSRATLSNGAYGLLEATIRIGGAAANGRPFVILRWRDNENA
jgi:general secretion pathway protein K